MTYYKVLNNDLQSCHGGTYQWVPGEWTPAVVVNPCYTGYHLCADTAQVLSRLGESIWTAEVRGQVVEAGDKVVVESARIVKQLPWDDRTARLFAADCAERVLHIFEAHSDSPAPRRAIEVARAYAVGSATMADLDAARELARDAARHAAWAAARSAAQAAAWNARRAAWASAQAAAWNARRAAWYAEREAAQAAAWYAGVAEREAAQAAGSVTLAAARVAERQWQADRLGWYLDGCPLPAPHVV